MDEVDELDEVDEVDEVEEEPQAPTYGRGRKRARSLLSASPESEGQSRSRRRRSTPPAAEVIPVLEFADPRLYLPKEAPPPVVKIVSAAPRLMFRTASTHDMYAGRGLWVPELPQSR